MDAWDFLDNSGAQRQAEDTNGQDHCIDGQTTLLVTDGAQNNAEGTPYDDQPVHPAQ